MKFCVYYVNEEIKNKQKSIYLKKSVSQCIEKKQMFCKTKCYRPGIIYSRLTLTFSAQTVHVHIKYLCAEFTQSLYEECVDIIDARQVLPALEVT